MQKFKNQANVLLILDPPYVATHQEAYANQAYFGMISFLKLMAYIKPPFIFFSSTRSEVKEYLDYLKEYEQDKWQKFDGLEMRTVNVTLGKNRQYEDNMMWKF